MTVPAPPAGVEARTSPLAWCAGEWLVRTAPHDGVRIHLYDRPEGRHIALSGYVANTRPRLAPGQAKAVAWALLRADDWAAAGPQPEPAPDPQLTIYDHLEEAACA